MSAVKCRVCASHDATLVCKCASLPIPLCVNCVTTHLNSSGNHDMGLLPSVPEVGAKRPEHNDFCVHCQQSYAETACLCSYPLPKICQECTEKHLKKATVELPHELVSVSDGKQIQSERELRECHNRLRAVLMVDNVGKEMSTAETRIEVIFGQLVQTVLHKKELLRSEIGTMRSEFEQRYKSAAAEVKSNLLNKAYVPSPGIASELWHSASSFSVPKFKCSTTAPNLRPQLDAIAVLGWEAVASGPPPQPPAVERVNQSRPIQPARLEERRQVERKTEERKVEEKKVEVRRETGYTMRTNRGREDGEIIPILSSTYLRCYSPKASEWQPMLPLSKSIDFDSSSSYTLLPDKSIFTCGRYNPISASAYVIVPETGEVYPLRPMTVARYQHGVICEKDVVFVFGGHERGALTNRCEKYSLQTDTWQDIQPLASPRECFTPIHHTVFIYIIGGRGTLNSERFDLRSQRFESIDVRMDRPEASCGLLLDSLMLILQSNYVLEVNTAGLTVSRKHYEGVFAWSNYTPVAVGRSLYVVSLYNEVIERVDTDGYQRSSIRIV